MKYIITKEQTLQIAKNINIDLNKYNLEQLHIGINVELEHGLASLSTNITDDDLEDTLKIAIAHLNEINIYYDLLLDLEKKYEDFRGKVVVITGGTDGFGLSIAKMLSKIYKVIIIGRNEEKLENVKKDLNCDGYICDVCDTALIQKTIEIIIDKYKKIDVLINNAGILFEGMISENTYEQISNTIDVNVKGTEYMVKEVSSYMINSHDGLIINVISQSGLYHRRFRSLYNSSKWAITGFTKCIAADLAKFNIRVTGFYPGKMNTGIFKNSDVIAEENSLDPNEAAKIIKFIIETPEIHIPEIGAKSIYQTSTDEICY